MEASKLHIEDDGGKKEPPPATLLVNDEVRQLADALVHAFDVLLKYRTSGNELPTSPVAFDMKLRFSMMLIALKVPSGAREVAIESLSQLGRVKNREFSSSREDHRYRSFERDKLRELREEGRPIADLIPSTGNFFLPASPEGEFLGSLDLTLAYGHDPLEEPATLQGENTSGTEILIFLEHYFPYELAETVRDLADTRLEEYPVDVQPAALLIEFSRCFRSFIVVRSSLLRPSREFSRFLDEAHARLLRLAEIVRDAALSAPAGKVAKPEKSDDMASQKQGAASVPPPQTASVELPSPISSAITKQTESVVQESRSLGGLPPLRIEIQKHPTEHLQFIVTGGKICSRKTSHKRTLITVALLLESKLEITPQSFSKLYYGQSGSHASQRFSEALAAVGLRQYKTETRPYRFSDVTFVWTDVSKEELRKYLSDTIRQ